MSVTSRPPILNAACKVKTDQAPLDLLKRIEVYATIRSGLLPIDIDIPLRGPVECYDEV